jgi:hypothetical protein
MYFQLLKEAAERCEEARHQFWMEIGAKSPERIVTADESAVNILTTYRMNGWSYKGICARKTCRFRRGMRCVVDYIFSVLFLTLYSVIRCCLPFQLM